MAISTLLYRNETLVKGNHDDHKQPQ